jgi:hypothetical protein
MVPHPKSPVPTFDIIKKYLETASGAGYGMVAVGVLGILYFTYRHLRLVAWNLREFRGFKQTEAHQTLSEGDSAVAYMAIPLTLGMTINVLFILAAVLVPGLWAYVEYMFPVALLVFTGLGVYAFRIFYGFFSRNLSTGGFDCANNNNLSQMLSIFAFVMLGVGFAASAAMSTNIATAAVGAFGAIFFNAAAVMLSIIKGVLGFRSMLEHGIKPEASMTLWIVIPILTLMGISMLRLNHGAHTFFDGGFGKAGFFLLTASLLSVQLFFGGLGYAVMKRLGYFKKFIHGDGKAASVYALICPGVALFVFGMFFLNLGLTKTGVISKFSPVYFTLLLPLIYLQLKTILTVRTLDKKMLRAEAAVAPTPARAS